MSEVSQNAPPLSPERPPAACVGAPPCVEAPGAAGSSSRRQSIINALLLTDRTLEDIAGEHGVSRQWVSRVAHGCGVAGYERRSARATSRQTVRKAERLSRMLKREAERGAKWSRVIAFRKSGFSQPFISESLGVPVTTVNYILCKSGMRTQAYQARSK